MTQAIIFRTPTGNIRLHQLKVWNEFYNDLITEDLHKRKTFEVRKFDRDYRVGDYLMLEKFEKDSNTYLNEHCYKKITYILNDEKFLPIDTVVLGLIDDIPSINF